MNFHTTFKIIHAVNIRVKSIETSYLMSVQFIEFISRICSVHFFSSGILAMVHGSLWFTLCLLPSCGYIMTPILCRTSGNSALYKNNHFYMVLFLHTPTNTRIRVYIHQILGQNYAINELYIKNNI